MRTAPRGEDNWHGGGTRARIEPTTGGTTAGSGLAGQSMTINLFLVLAIVGLGLFLVLPWWLL